MKNSAVFLPLFGYMQAKFIADSCGHSDFWIGSRLRFAEEFSACPLRTLMIKTLVHLSNLFNIFFK
jgi:hypothetical protein